MVTNSFFPEIQGNLGFGCMRLPMNGEEVNYPEFIRMVDEFIAAGFNYFDTAHGYLNGRSETAIADCVAKRYERRQFLMTNKLTDSYFKTQEEIRPFFEQQLAWCGVEYFDFYLMHAQDKNNYEKFKRCRAYETAYRFKEEGLIRHFGISFHDRAEVLEQILTEHPEIEVVQIQFNYVDYEDASVDSRRVYEVCEKHKKPVIVMEPVKGGSLVNLPAEADRILRELNGGSNASYALRFAAGFPQMIMVLSGMSTPEQMQDNIGVMRDFQPLSPAETAAVAKVCAAFKNLNLIPCTSCRYCIEENECPKAILIPDMFAALNSREAFHGWNAKYYYKNSLIGGGHGKASECIGCGKCERVCPQHLEIRNLLTKVAAAFENKEG
ncbi:Fe-S oxidoreductase [Lachnospiraceae bacterium oral taxon 500]|nr:Fe-S oxidoreductase [Lachnospiraceae bacterium oral taxon 500]